MENIDKIKCVLIDFENSDKTLDEAAKEILLLFSVSGRSEQFYCVSSNALVYGKPCEKWCGDENCKALCKQ